jgi:segregation and condensation protein B
MTTGLKEIIESLIFISLEPLSVEKIKEVLTDIPASEVDQALADLLQTYAAQERGIQIIQTAGGFVFSTRPEFDPWVRRLLKIDKKSRLSSAAMETLSAIAYHQPITLSEISALRDVDSTYTLKTLLQKKLVKIVGRKNSPGRPLIYRTTERFLTYFGLNSLADLPTEEEISKILGEEKNLEQK